LVLQAQTSVINSPEHAVQHVQAHKRPTPLHAAGWILFLVFAGWGIFAAPIDWIFQYIRRPKAVITKSEYIDRARGLAMRAKDIKV
jgi:hypothetical protein